MSDYEPPSVSSVTTPKARKPHVCCECPHGINVGDKYELVKGCWDGEWTTIKTCIRCVRLRNEYDSGDGYVYGELEEMLQCRAHEDVYEAWKEGVI